ncbi:ubiquinol-cytochrome C chaperone family protein [Elioraea sp.]|jgi:cytochrome b pre-mRNA-processing protein 3|uniref:ubiquinol-cytochrome C chaperone family protein n=1 Tax=Elioraea sp. TaxID=2185103 RepID=UPI003F72D20D
MPLSRLFRRRPFEREGYLLYGAAVAAARDRAWYLELGVPDTLDGRFDMVALFAFLVIERMREEPGEDPKQLSQAVFDAMFSDMDQNLREMGVADLGVGKRVKRMWEAFHGRATAYTAALGAADDRLLVEALSRNVWRSVEPVAAGSRLAQAMRRQRAQLGAQSFAAFRRGEVLFLPAAEALA